MQARIVNKIEFGGIHQTSWLFDNKDIIIGGQLVSEWELVEELPNPLFKQPQWNGTEWYESYVEVIEVPQEISKMALSLRLLEINISDQDIFDDIDSIPDSMFPPLEKAKAKVKYITARTFERHDADLNLIATMEGLSQGDVDQIFIGN